MTRSIQEGFLFGSTPEVVSPSGHQNCEWPLKSPVKKDAYGFSFLILEYKFVKFDKNTLNSGEVWTKSRTSI